MLRSLPAEPDYLDLHVGDVLGPGDLAGVAGRCLDASRNEQPQLRDWYRELALAIATHFEIETPVVGALLSRAGTGDLENALVEAAHPGRGAVLRELWRLRGCLLLVPGAWSGAPATDPFAAPLDSSDLERQVDELAGALLAHADTTLLLVRSLDRAIVGLWTGDPARSMGRVTVGELQAEGLALRGG